MSAYTAPPAGQAWVAACAQCAGPWLLQHDAPQAPGLTRAGLLDRRQREHKEGTDRAGRAATAAAERKRARLLPGRPIYSIADTAAAEARVASAQSRFARPPVGNVKPVFIREAPLSALPSLRRKAHRAGFEPCDISFEKPNSPMKGLRYLHQRVSPGEQVGIKSLLEDMEAPLYSSFSPQRCFDDPTPSLRRTLAGRRAATPSGRSRPATDASVVQRIVLSRTPSPAPGRAYILTPQPA